MPQPPSATPGILARTAVLIAVIAPAILLYLIVYRQFTPIPLLDDYHALLAFLLDYRTLTTPAARLSWIVAAQHVDYKLVLEHLLVVSDWTLTHHIHLTPLALLGNLAPIGIAFLLWSAGFAPAALPGRSLQQRLLLAIPASLIFFSLCDWAIFNHTMSALQNFFALLFTLLALKLLNDSRLTLAILAATLACLSSANGFLLAPLGLPFLIPRRHWRSAILWLTAFIPLIAIYLYRCAPIPHPPAKALYYKPAFLVIFMGSAAPTRWLSLPLGVAIFALIALAARARFDRINPVIAWFAIWLFGSSLLAASARTGLGLNSAVSSRYQINSLLLLVCAYIFLLPRIAHRLLASRLTYAATVIACVLFCLHADIIGNAELRDRRILLQQGLGAYLTDPLHNSPIAAPPQLVRGGFLQGEAEYERVILTQSIQTGLYQPPATP